MNNVKIRRLESEEDYESIYEITAESWEPIYSHRKKNMNEKIFTSIYHDGPINKAKQVREWCAKNPENVRVAQIEEKVVGFITWMYDSPANGHVELHNNAVHPSAQRKGVATLMYDWFFKHAKAHGYQYANVFTGLDPAHEGGRKAYEKLGFSDPISYVKYYKEL